MSHGEVLPGVTDLAVVLPRAFDRKAGTSISVEEAGHLAAITRWCQARNALEIGTWDGNTALVLAAKTRDDGRVVTVDLPPDFQAEQQGALAFTEG